MKILTFSVKSHKITIVNTTTLHSFFKILSETKKEGDKMTKEQKISLLSERQRVLAEKGDYNLGICRKLAREIRKLEQE